MSSDKLSYDASAEILNLRTRLLLKLEDLKHKIESNEDFPERSQDYNTLGDIDENIDACLSMWYY